MNVYGAAQDENKEEFLIELGEFIYKCHVPYIVGGDFNIWEMLVKRIKSFMITDSQTYSKLL